MILSHVCAAVEGTAASLFSVLFGAVSYLIFEVWQQKYRSRLDALREQI